MPSTTSEESSSSTSFDPTLFPDIHRDDIIVGEQLGVGSFGAVFKGTWNISDGNIRSVALKKVFVLEKEAEILSKIRHKNIIQFYGICKTTSDFFIVTECAERGSLYDHIHSDKCGFEHCFDGLIGWALQIANGIQYLHNDAVDTIIHRDLKSKNVVLDANLICKICDFGTSKDLTHSCTAPTWGGTAAWMSPEMIMQSEGITTATDVWSYGVVLWEILSREVPFKEYTEFRIYSIVTQQGINLAIPDSCPLPLKNIMLNCWKMQPKERMKMKQIVGELSKIEGDVVLELEDWRIEIENQTKNVEKLRKDLEKRKEKLEIREKALNQRIKVEQAVMASARHPPQDVQQWSEHHTSHWIENILNKSLSGDQRFLDRVNAAVFRNRITGARLLEITQNDLEHLGVYKLGSRIDVMKAIGRLKDQQKALHNFPTLEVAMKKDSQTKSRSPGKIPSNITLVLLLGVYIRKIDENRRKLKFYVDSDWGETSSDLKSKSTSAFIKTVCFSVLDDYTKKPIHEPACSISSGMTSNPDWITVENIQRTTIRVVASVYFADSVANPREIEIVEVVDNLNESRILQEKQVVLKFHRDNSSSSSTSTDSGFVHHTTSTPQLRGFWHKKMNNLKHGLTETELSRLQENMKQLEVPSGIAVTGRRRTFTHLEENDDDTKKSNENLLKPPRTRHPRPKSKDLHLRKPKFT
ncbi:unnamed protein product [Caenorhabditis angaria]|uniref:Mitogen-activated protein kinase kinase kinase n=1 Tax=Caenorhabditis angaria TaxID=860376 RepID=A0A9P1N363_9PELO|nr:unnamed protein product [Caenorhabditis angaria]